jgi:hypothetical protein
MTLKTSNAAENLLITNGEFATHRGYVAAGCRPKALATPEQASRRIELRRESFWRRRSPPSIESLNRRFKSDPKIRGMICLRVKPNARDGRTPPTSSRDSRSAVREAQNASVSRPERKYISGRRENASVGGAEGIVVWLLAGGARGLPTRDQVVHATFFESVSISRVRALEQSKRVRVVSMAIRIRRSRSATARRERP